MRQESKAGDETKEIEMGRVQICSAALLLGVSAGAWAGVEPYPEAVIGPDVSTKTRAQVVTELHEAIRAGKMYDFPNMYADKVALAQARQEIARTAQPAARSDDTVVVWGNARVVRARVQAEAAEANRLGLLSFAEGDPPVATAAQEQLISAAGQRAAEQMVRQISSAESAVRVAAQ
jgi:hypothetical protein